MKPSPISASMLVVSLFLAPALLAQSPDSANQNAASPAASAPDVPRLIKFSGTLLDAQDRPMAGPVGVTFALHAQQTGGAALWLETQNVKPDANGAYTVLLGANSANGVPAELFASGEARWLEVQVERQAEQPRVLLVSVPYALKAKDAETLGGKPASAFVTTETLAGAGSSAGAAAAPSSSTASTTLPSSKAQTTSKKASSAAQPAVACGSVTSDGAAAVNSIALFTTNCNIEGSLMTQALINGFPGVSVAGNNAGLLLTGTGTHQVTVTGATSGRLGQDAGGFFFASDSNGSSVRFLTNNGTLNEWMRITSAGNVGIATPTPGARLEVAGNVMVSNGGIIAGSGAGLTNVNAALLNGLASTAFATMGANSFTGNQSITGDVNLTGSLGLPHTTGATGVITMAGIPFMHNFGVNNTFLGGGAGNFAMTGQSNTAIGANSLLINSTGVANTAVGAGALDNSTDGGNNTASGTLALQANTTGNNNTAVGFNAGVTPTNANANTTGSNNTFLGFQSGPGTSTQLSNTTAIGANALVNCNNCMVLGDSTTPMSVGIRTNSPGQALSVAGTIQSITGGFMFPDSTVQTTASLGGSVSSVGSGLGLTGGPITGSGTLAINPMVVPQLTASSNTFTGSISASSFNGSGAGLSNVNAAMLNGLASTAFATAGANSFTGNQSVTGNVSVTGNLALPNTTSGGTAGVVTLGGSPFLHDFGTNNTFVGASAGNMAMTGSGANTAVGASALAGNTTGAFNSTFGAGALSANTTGANNAAFGYTALRLNTTGNFNSAFGYQALFSNTTGNANAAFGDDALFHNTTAGDNSAFGHDALNANTTGNSNSAFGSHVLQANTTGSGNAAFGINALIANTMGGSNAAFGGQALQSNTTGGSNAAFGGNALFNLTAGDFNTAIGTSAGVNLTTGSNNIYLGSLGPASAGSESNTIRIGSGQTSTFLAGTVTATKFLGDGSGLTGIAALGASNTFSGLETFTAAPSGGGVGQGSLYINPAAASAGQTLLGAAVNNVQQMRLDSGGNLTLAGTLRLPNTNGAGTAGVVSLGGTRFLHNFGTNNAFLGAGAGNTSMTGNFNSAFGFDALNANTTGNGNAAFGFDALLFNTTGSSNAAFGGNALFNNTTGASNAAFGAGALFVNATGTNNAAFGLNALANLTSGDSNTAIGTNAGVNLTTGSNNIYLGSLGPASAGSESNTIRIGSNGITVQQNGTSPNILNGFNGNTVGSAVGATVSGGGVSGAINSGTGAWSTVSGGEGNTASGGIATVSGGYANTAGAFYASVGGGAQNIASGELATVSGGSQNTASGFAAMVSGGENNTAAGLNSFAAGSFANAMHNGTFVWADNSSQAGFASTAANQFLIRASGGVGISTTSPSHQLEVLDAGNTGLRVQTNTAGGTVASFGGNGAFQIDAPSIVGGRFVVQDSTGNVGIGTPTPDNLLSVNGPADKPGGGSWGTFSDARLKNLHGDFHSGLAEVLKLNPIRYRYKEQNALGIKDQEEHVGFVAQDVQKVIPEAVSADDLGYLLVNNDPILWAMLNAIKEQQMLISRQQDQLQVQRAEIGQLASQVRLMQASLRGTHQSSAVRATKTQMRTRHARTANMIPAAQTTGN